MNSLLEIIKHLSNLRFLLLFLTITSLNQSWSQNIHSHNDYEQEVPFWYAFSSGLNSIEVDIFLKDNKLYVTHEESEIKLDRTIENLYLKPIQKVISLQLGGPKHLQLLIDIKSEAEPTLRKLIAVLKKYPEIINNDKITLTISGNRPPAETFNMYPYYIKFDYQSLEAPENWVNWEKVSLISLNFKKISSWNGLGRLTAEDFINVKNAVDLAHSYNKPFRFWGTPDTKTAWKTLNDLGVNYINTDKPFECINYCKTLELRTYKNEITSDVYIPTYESDKRKGIVKNVILLIGDGNGLSQISAATLANGGALTLTQLKSIGFIKTSSTDDFTTDSAAAGTALATGSKTYNRSIGLDTLGRPLTNITELLYDNGYISGCITTDRLTGATPASFYSHQKDRSLISNIASDLPKSKLSLFIGGGKEDFDGEKLISNYTIIKDLDNIDNSKSKKIGYFFANGDVPSVLQNREGLLAKATKKGIEFLDSKMKPFFLMVESAKIDKYGHKNNVSGIVSEGIDFDRAITEAIKYADKAGNTLVIITADHETSGFSIPQGSIKNKVIEGDFTTIDHTASMVPIFAYGPLSQEFQGVYENNEVFHKILDILKIDY